MNQLVPCPQCGTKNRIPNHKPAHLAKCGTCKAQIFTGKPLTLTQSNFIAQVGGEVPILVDFWADWCGPCKMMAPILEQAAQRWEPKIRVGKVDTEAERELSTRFLIRSIPTLVLLQGGEELAQISGAMSLLQLESWIEQHLK